MVELHDGRSIPQLGFGVFQVAGDEADNEEGKWKGQERAEVEGTQERQSVK